MIDFVQTTKGMKPLVNVGGIANQPGLDICNNTLQKLMCAPYNWRFNKFEVRPFTTIPYQQDYWISNCNAFCKGRYAVHLNAINSPKGAGLTQAGNLVTALFNDFAPNGLGTGLGPTVGDTVIIDGAGQSGYNITATISAVPTPTSFQYQALASGLADDGGQGFTNPGINWMEHVSMSDFQCSSTITPVHDGEIVASLAMESICQPPIKWCYQVEKIYIGSNLTVAIPKIRSWPVPGSQIWGIYLFYQGKAPVKTDLTQTWLPWPDDLGFVLRSNVKAQALDHWEDPRAVNSMLIAEQDILKALGSKDQELRSESMFPDMPLMRGG